MIRTTKHSQQKQQQIPVQPRPYCVSSFQTIYGLGRARARKLNHIVFNHPLQLSFRYSWRDLLDLEAFKSLFLLIPTDAKIRLFVAYRLAAKMDSFSYQMYRFFQNLPAGGRTKANAGTPAHFNYYLSLNVNSELYHNMVKPYKRQELLLNQRFEELKAYDSSAEEEQKKTKAAMKNKKKAAKEAFMRTQKVRAAKKSNTY